MEYALEFLQFHPKKRLSNNLAIAISFVGLVLAGIIVALALNAASHAFKDSSDFKELADRIEQIEKAYE